MFILKELDKLLQDIGAAGRSVSDNAKPISLPDIEPIDIGRLNLPEKLNLPFGPPITNKDMARIHHQYQNPFESNKMIAGDTRYPTTDSLFLRLMNQFVFAKLVKLPERHYPWAKLLICDRLSYDLLLKHERISSSSMKNFIYRAPFLITAIFELDNIVTLFDRSNEPIIVNKRDPRTGKTIIVYNYGPIKKVFPYLRMSDLVLIIEDKYQLDNKLLRILHFLAHFARSFQLIELGGLNKIIGSPHSIYNNVLIVRPKSPEWTDYYSQLPLVYLSFMATQLASIADKLKLRLETVTYRAADPHQQTRVFAHFLSTAVDKKVHDLLDSRVARVLVMDRFYNLRATLLHADRFEAFMTQEKSQLKSFTSATVVGQSYLERPTLGSVDEQLNSKLYLVRLTEVLGVILKHAMHLKPTKQSNKQTIQNRAKRIGGKDRRGRSSNKPPTLPTPSPQYSLSEAMSASQSIRRNLDIVKLLYKSLNEGYLIVLKLESSLESITAELRQSADKPLDENRQIALAERLQRLVSAWKQLIKVPTKTIDSTDMTRLGCLIADAINLFSVHNRRDRAADLVAKAKLSLKEEKNFKSNDDNGDDDANVNNNSRFDSSRGANNLYGKYQAFDSLSVSNCGRIATLSIDEILEKILDDSLDEKSYPSNKLVEDPKFSKDIKTTIVLVFLGALSAGELTQIKLIERQLKKQYQLCDILVLCAALVTPNDFLAAL